MKNTKPFYGCYVDRMEEKSKNKASKNFQINSYVYQILPQTRMNNHQWSKSNILVF